MALLPALMAATLHPTLFILDNATIPTSVNAPHYVITNYHVSQIEMIDSNGKQSFGSISDLTHPPLGGFHIGPYDQALNVKFNGDVPEGVNIFLTTIESVDVNYKHKTIHVNCHGAQANVNPMININVVSIFNDSAGILSCYISR